VAHHTTNHDHAIAARFSLVLVPFLFSFRRERSRHSNYVLLTGCGGGGGGEGMGGEGGMDDGCGMWDVRDFFFMREKKFTMKGVSGSSEERKREICQ
jgi:hypothetical protein